MLGICALYAKSRGETISEKRASDKLSMYIEIKKTMSPTRFNILFFNLSRPKKKNTQVKNPMETRVIDFVLP